jgi:hypothetical protein
MVMAFQTATINAYLTQIQMVMESMTAKTNAHKMQARPNQDSVDVA